MSVQIKSVDLVVPGHVVRTRGGDADTVLTLSGEQVVSIYGALKDVVHLFEPAVSTTGETS